MTIREFTLPPHCRGAIDDVNFNGDKVKATNKYNELSSVTTPAR